MDTRIFPEETPTRCNRDCQGTYPLPESVRGIKENAKVYRLQSLVKLDCGHLDCHWIYLSDLPEEIEQ